MMAVGRAQAPSQLHITSTTAGSVNSLTDPRWDDRESPGTVEGTGRKPCEMDRCFVELSSYLCSAVSASPRLMTRQGGEASVTYVKLEALGTPVNKASETQLNITDYYT
jgi:hypothetical protein